jgi:hypothetical protein
MANLPLIKMKPARMTRYGVTERKKAELDALTLQVLDAQQQVDQYQAIVTALTGKLSNFQALLAINDTDRANALNNKTLVDQLVQSFLDLQNNSSIAFNEMAEAEVTTNALAVSINNVIEKLIYTAEMINKLAANVTRKKALNPLISDDLVSMLTTAGADANNAVALTLVALQTAFAAQATNKESNAATSLEYVQSMDVYQLITGTDMNGNKVVDKDGKWIGSLQHLLHKAYKKSKTNYADTQLAVKLTTEQLNEAQLNLNAALVTLQSLQLGLAAGNAAALAS